MRHETVQRIIDCGAAAVIRMAEAVRPGGVTAIEVTMTTPGALQVIEEVSEKLAGACAVGVGGSALLGKDAIASGDFDQLTENARALRRSIREARNQQNA